MSSQPFERTFADGSLVRVQTTVPGSFLNGLVGRIEEGRWFEPVPPRGPGGRATPGAWWYRIVLKGGSKTFVSADWLRKISEAIYEAAPPFTPDTLIRRAAEVRDASLEPDRPRPKRTRRNRGSPLTDRA